MLNLLAKKARGGDLCINLARQHLLKHEWGLARLALEDGISRGNLSEPKAAQVLLDEVNEYLGIRRLLVKVRSDSGVAG